MPQELSSQFNEELIFVSNSYNLLNKKIRPKRFYDSLNQVITPSYFATIVSATILNMKKFNILFRIERIHISRPSITEGLEINGMQKSCTKIKFMEREMGRHMYGIVKYE